MQAERSTPAPSSRGVPVRLACGLALIAIIAFAAVIYASRAGLATSADSARYIQWAREIAGEDKSPAPSWSPGEQAHYPPFYPLLLAALSRRTFDPLSAARWLNAALFAINTILAGAIVWRATRCAPAAIFAAAAMLVSPTCVFIHTWMLSEALFIAFMLGAIATMASGIERPRFGIFAGAGLLVSAATLTRYAGIALLPVGILVILWQVDCSRAKRLAFASIFCACVILPPTGWAIRNVVVLGSATHRVLAMHPISSRHLAETMQTMGGWFWSAQSLPAKFLAAVIIAGVVLISVWMVYRSRRQGAMPVLALLLLLFIGSFSLLLIASISLVDFHTPLDVRICAPIYVAGLMLASLALAWAMPCRRRCAVAAIGAAVAFLGLSAAASSHTLIDLHANGGGFSRRIWRDSPTIHALASMPGSALIYSNAPGAIYLVTGRRNVLPIPSPIDLSSLQANDAYGEQLQKMQDNLDGRAVIVYFDRYAGGQRSPPAPNWRSQLKLKMLAHRSDGAIYVGSSR